MKEKCQINIADERLQKRGGWNDHVQLGTSGQVKSALSWKKRAGSDEKQGDDSWLPQKVGTHPCVQSLPMEMLGTEQGAPL